MMYALCFKIENTYNIKNIITSNFTHFEFLKITYNLFGP